MKSIYSLAIAAAIAVTPALPLYAQSSSGTPLNGPVDNPNSANGTNASAPLPSTGVERTLNRPGGGDNEQPSVPANGTSGSSSATPSKPGVSETAPRVGTSGTNDRGVMNR